MAETAHTEHSSEHGHGHGGGGHGGHGHDDAKAHERHYWRVYWALVVLFGISVAGPFIGTETGIVALTLITAFGVAVVKAALVVKNFMHLTVEPRFVMYVTATALVLMGLFFFWVSPDVMKHEGHQWVNVAALAAAGEAHVVDEGEFDAQETFDTVCSTCHDMKGHGDGPASATLDPKPANFTSAEFWATRDIEHVKQVITRGGAAMNKSPLMPSFGEAYTPEQIAEIAEVIAAFRPEEAQPVAAADAGVAPGEQVAPEEQVAAADAGVPVEEQQVAEAPPAEPEGPSEAEIAQRAAWITQRLYR